MLQKKEKVCIFTLDSSLPRLNVGVVCHADTTISKIRVKPVSDSESESEWDTSGSNKSVVVSVKPKDNNSNKVCLQSTLCDVY